jgi:hypothetical protein
VFADPLERADRLERGAAERAKAVVGADPRHAEDVLPDPGQLSRGAVGERSSGADTRRPVGAEPREVDLAVLVERQAVQAHHDRGHHHRREVRRQPL